MFRPHTPLFNLATDAPGGGGSQAALLRHIAASDSQVAKLPGLAAIVSKADEDGKAAKEAADAQAAADAAKAAEDQAAADAAKAAVDAEAAKKTADPDPSEDGDDEIKPEDTAEQQLAKLRKAQKKLLSRVDKITAERNELRQKLEQPEPEANTPGDPLGHLHTADELNAYTKQIDGYLIELQKNAAKGMTIPDGKGGQRELAPQEVVEEIIFWSGVKADSVPSRRDFIARREAARQASQEAFKPYAEKTAFTEAAAKVKQDMSAYRGVLPDFDQITRERALASMVLSGDYELVPKRKPSAGGVESAPPVKPKAPVPPVAPPSSGGPPIKPSGAGPDLAQLEENMRKHPGDPRHLQAYLRAKVLPQAA